MGGGGAMYPYQDGGGGGGGSYPGTVARGLGGNEAQAVLALDKAYNKPVAFSVRTNVMYDGTLDDDSPVHGCAVRYGLHFIFNLHHPQSQTQWTNK